MTTLRNSLWTAACWMIVAVGASAGIRADDGQDSGQPHGNLAQKWVEAWHSHDADVVAALLQAMHCRRPPKCPSPAWSELLPLRVEDALQVGHVLVVTRVAATRATPPISRQFDSHAIARDPLVNRS